MNISKLGEEKNEKTYRLRKKEVLNHIYATNIHSKMQHLSFFFVFLSQYAPFSDKTNE